MKIKFITFCLIFLFICMPCLAGKKHPEKWYQEKWSRAHNGRMEVEFGGHNTKLSVKVVTHSM